MNHTMSEHNQQDLEYNPDLTHYVHQVACFVHHPDQAHVQVPVCFQFLLKFRLLASTSHQNMAFSTLLLPVSLVQDPVYAALCAAEYYSDVNYLESVKLYSAIFIFFLMMSLCPVSWQRSYVQAAHIVLVQSTLAVLWLWIVIIFIIGALLWNTILQPGRLLICGPSPLVQVLSLSSRVSSGHF
jgi:hypothetical protein